MRKRDLKQKSILYCKNHKTSINDLDDFAKDFTDLDGKDFDTLLEYIRMIREEEIKKKKPLKKDIDKPEVCPKCGGTHIIRNGIQNGKQRFYCYGNKSIKPHTFTLDKTLPAMGRCELVDSDEREYVKNLLNHNTLQNIADDFGMATSTAFNWRHKILTVLKEHLENNNVFDGRVEVDEIFFPLNFSGNVNALKNLKSKDKESNNKSTYLIYRPSKKLHKRGKSIKKAGLSKELVCVVTALNVPTTGAIGKCSNLGKPSTSSVTSILGNLFGSEVVMITDHEKSTHKFALEHGIPVIQVAKGDKGEHINNINSLHSKLRSIYKQHKGISTKHLENYIALGLFEHMNSYLSTEEKIEKMLTILHEVKKPIEYSDIKSKRYPAFFYNEEEKIATENEPNIYIPSWDMDSINLSPSKSTIKVEDNESLYNDKMNNGFFSNEEFELSSGKIPF